MVDAAPNEGAEPDRDEVSNSPLQTGNGAAPRLSAGYCAGANCPAGPKATQPGPSTGERGQSCSGVPLPLGGVELPHVASLLLLSAVPPPAAGVRFLLAASPLRCVPPQPFRRDLSALNLSDSVVRGWP